jgi:quercetin dioxygenase-like cupin family protein
MEDTMMTPSANRGQVRCGNANSTCATHELSDRLTLNQRSQVTSVRLCGPEKRNAIDGKSSGPVRQRRRGLSAALALLGAALAPLGAARASETDKPAIPVLVTSVLTAAVTATGQPIVFPPVNARVVVSTYDIAPGATLPEHKHPFARYAYVLAGRLRIANTETGQSSVYKTGDFIIEAIGQWHKAVSLDARPVKLLVVDQVAGDLNNIVMRK